MTDKTENSGQLIICALLLKASSVLPLLVSIFLNDFPNLRHMECKIDMWEDNINMGKKEVNLSL
jgi:hypothetical protein